MRTLILSRPDRVGDVVISTSCLAPIRDKHPDAKIYFVAQERMRPLLENHPLLDGFIPLSADLESEFCRVNASAIVHLHPDADCYLAAAKAAIPMRIGYPVRFLNRHLTHRIKERRKKGLQHEAAYNFDLLAPIDVEMPKKFSTSVYLPENARETLQPKLPWPMDSTAYAVLHPTAHSKIARWPAERFLQLAEWLKKKFDLQPVFIGADANDSFHEPYPGRDIALRCPQTAPRAVPTSSSFLNLSGKTGLGELGWLLKHARVLVTSDSGPGHLASAVDCPVVAIFGRTAPLYGPVRWRPLSDRAVIVSKPLERKRFEGRDAHWCRCFAAIEINEVQAAVMEVLHESARVGS